MPTRVIMVGKSNKVMAQMAEDMGAEFDVTHTEDIEGVRQRLNAEKFDVAILGRALKEQDRQSLLQTVHGADGLAVITSLAPCGQLSAAHARAALSAADPGHKTLTLGEVTGKEVAFELAAPARVTVTLYTLSTFRYLLKVKPIEERDFPAGRHRVTIPRTFIDTFERKHLYVAADNGDAYLVKMRGL